MNNKWNIFLLAVISFVINTAQFVIIGILDKIAASIGVSVSTVGQLATVFSLANAIGTPIVMMATAKMDRRKQLLLALSILSLGMISTAALPGFGFLMASRAALGLGMGICTVCCYSIVAKLAPPGRQAGAMANLALGSSAALVLGVPLGRVISALYDWKAIFWFFSILTLLAIFAVARTIPSTESQAPIPLSKQLALLKQPKITVALGATFFMFISYSVVNTYITLFMTSVMPTIERQLSAILLGLGIASVVGSKLGGLLADRIGAARTLVGGMVVQAIALVLISIVHGSIFVTISLFIIWAIAAWTVGPTFNFNLISIAPEASGIILSLNGSFIQFGFAAGAVVGGIAIESLSVIANSWIGAASVGFAACIGAYSFGLFSNSSSSKKA